MVWPFKCFAFMPWCVSSGDALLGDSGGESGRVMWLGPTSIKGVALPDRVPFDVELRLVVTGD